MGISDRSIPSTETKGRREAAAATPPQVVARAPTPPQTAVTTPPQVVTRAPTPPQTAVTTLPLISEEAKKTAITELKQLLPGIENLRKNIRELCGKDNLNTDYLKQPFAQYTLMMLGDIMDDVKKNYYKKNKKQTPDNESEAEKKTREGKEEDILFKKAEKHFCDIISSSITNHVSDYGSNIDDIKERVKFVVRTLLPQIRNETLHVTTMDTQFLKLYNEEIKGLDIDYKDALHKKSYEWLNTNPSDQNDVEIGSYIDLIMEIVKLDRQYFPDVSEKESRIKRSPQMNRLSRSGAQLIFCQSLAQKTKEKKTQYPKSDDTCSVQSTQTTEMDTKLTGLAKELQNRSAYIKNDKKVIKKLVKAFEKNIKKISSSANDISQRDNNAINRADKFTTFLHNFLKDLQTEYEGYKNEKNPPALRHFHLVRFITVHNELEKVLFQNEAQEFLASSTKSDKNDIECPLPLTVDDPKKVVSDLKPILEQILDAHPKYIIETKETTMKIVLGDEGDEISKDDKIMQAIKELKNNIKPMYDDEDKTSESVAYLKMLCSHGSLRIIPGIKKLFTSSAKEDTHLKVQNMYSDTVQKPLQIITQRLTQDPLCMMSEDESQRQDNPIQRKITCLQKTVNLLSDLEMSPHRLNAIQIRQLVIMLEYQIPSVFKDNAAETLINQYKTVRSAFYKAFIGEEDPYKESREVYMDIQNTNDEVLQNKANKFMENSDAINLMSKLFKNLNELALCHSTEAINISEHIIIPTSLDREYDALA